MNRYQSFIFKDYAFDVSTKKLVLTYSFDDALTFQESFVFDFDFAAYDEVVLDRAVQNLFYMAGVSYYKAYMPAQITIAAGTISPLLSSFISRTWQNGLGEFFYVNKLDPRQKIELTPNTEEDLLLPYLGNGLLVGLGGGKDSLVSVELLRDSDLDVATWSVGHKQQLSPLVERIGIPHYWVERTWDRQLLSLNDDDAYNGHIPISAILATVGTIVAILTGRRDVIVSNEQSANEPTLVYDGVAINHQYSKSQTFETDYQTVLRAQYGDSLRYYSLLRPLSELRIAELFAGNGFTTYHDVFSSCNHAFTHTSTHIFWDGTCPKCAFVFLALTPFITRERLEKLFSGKNLLLDPVLKPTYRQLLGIEGDKPLECVGEIKESRAAMRLAQLQYPELKQYVFDLPENYDYRTISQHEMPADIWELIAEKLSA